MNVRKTQLRVNMVYMFIKGNDKRDQYYLTEASLELTYYVV
jgi:hypothetical protein